DGDKAKTAHIELVRGALRFVSGTSDRKAYEIKTGVATIGVRGSVHDISFSDGKLIFNAVDGIGIVCGAGVCKEIKAGDPAAAVTLNSFGIASPEDVKKILNALDKTHKEANNAIGKTGNEPTGAAGKGNNSNNNNNNNNNSNKDNNSQYGSGAD